MTKIEAGVLGRAVNDENHIALSLIPTSEYSLVDIFKNVNQLDKHFLKYIPNSFLTEEQKKSQDMSVSLGVQFSNAVTSLNSNTIIRQAKAFVKQNSENFQSNSVRDPKDQSNRSLLANALEVATQNDIEENKLAQYKNENWLLMAISVAKPTQH